LLFTKDSTFGRERRVLFGSLTKEKGRKIPSPQGKHINLKSLHSFLCLHYSYKMKQDSMFPVFSLGKKKFLEVFKQILGHQLLQNR
jgi:hypothetical protein